MIALGLRVDERFAIDELYAEYAAALDERRYDDWLELFLEDCSYRVVARENYDRGLPLATLAFESKGMLRDRIYGISQTLFHEAYYQRHLVSGLRASHADDGIAVQCNYLIVRTKNDALSQVYSVGRYVDRVRFVDNQLKFVDKLAIFDSELIPNSMIYPI